MKSARTRKNFQRKLKFLIISSFSIVMWNGKELERLGIQTGSFKCFNCNSDFFGQYDLEIHNLTCTEEIIDLSPDDENESNANDSQPNANSSVTSGSNPASSLEKEPSPSVNETVPQKFKCIICDNVAGDTIFVTNHIKIDHGLAMSDSDESVDICNSWVKTFLQRSATTYVSKESFLEVDAVYKSYIRFIHSKYVVQPVVKPIAVIEVVSKRRLVACAQ